MAYLLKKLKVRFVFLTMTLGADPEYNSVPYYTDSMEDDQRRVNALFERSEAEGIPILRQSLHIYLLREICLSSSCLIIVLVP